MGSVLRAETTIHNGSDFRVYRPKEGDPEGKLAWRKMRRGIADLHRRAEVSRKAAERYLDAFASVDEATTLEELLQHLGQPRQWRGRRVRALRPFADDRALLAAVHRGEFALNGFRNRDLRGIFFPRLVDPEEARRRSAWVSRKLRLLRAHNLISKITGTHRYQLTSAGRKAITAILSALRSSVSQLTPAAACKSSREEKILKRERRFYPGKWDPRYKMLWKAAAIDFERSRWARQGPKCHAMP
ncbi:MAG: hypothetical protein WAU92_15705 [Candidatus Sulfotelmatobacter sp.]